MRTIGIVCDLIRIAVFIVRRCVRGMRWVYGRVRRKHGVKQVSRIWPRSRRELRRAA
jgi:hypothetical protein